MHFGLNDSSLENGTAASLSTQHAPQLGSAGSHSRAWGGCHRHLQETGTHKTGSSLNDFNHYKGYSHLFPLSLHPSRSCRPGSSGFNLTISRSEEYKKHPV